MQKLLSGLEIEVMRNTNDYLISGWKVVPNSIRTTASPNWNGMHITLVVEKDDPKETN